MQIARLAAAQRGAETLRMQAGAEQRLVRIDVAEPSEELLVQKQRLEPFPAPR